FSQFDQSIAPQAALRKVRLREVVRPLDLLEPPTRRSLGEFELLKLLLLGEVVFLVTPRFTLLLRALGLAVFLAVVFFLKPVDFFAAGFLATDFFAVDFLAGDFFAVFLA